MSTSSTARSPKVATASLTSRVTPGVGSTTAFYRRSRRLKIEDFPAFGRPAITTRGSASAAAWLPGVISRATDSGGARGSRSGGRGARATDADRARSRDLFGGRGGADRGDAPVRRRSRFRSVAAFPRISAPTRHGAYAAVSVRGRRSECLWCGRRRNHRARSARSRATASRGRGSARLPRGRLGERILVD